MTPELLALIDNDGRGGRVLRPLNAADAGALLAALLSGEVAASERAALLAALCARTPSLPELTGYVRALDAHTGRLAMPRDGPRPIVLPAYGGALRQANLTALVALLLERYGVPVLLHGFAGAGPMLADGDAAHDALRDGPDGHRVSTAAVLWELGVEPALSLADAQARLLREAIAYLPIRMLAPGFARLLAACPPPSPLAMLASLVDPFAGDGYRVVSVASADELALMRNFLRESRAAALLLAGTEGEPFANPRRQPRLEDFADGMVSECADAETADALPGPRLPGAVEAPVTAAWIGQVLAGTEPVPPPLIAQLGCCLAGARRLGVAA